MVSAAQRDEPQGLVPISMAVWTAQAIDMSGAKYFGALANLTPGVEFDSYPDYSAGIETNIAIRGVNSKDGSTTAFTSTTRQFRWIPAAASVANFRCCSTSSGSRCCGDPRACCTAKARKVARSGSSPRHRP